jgi:hypothetical protein
MTLAPVRLVSASSVCASRSEHLDERPAVGLLLDEDVVGLEVAVDDAGGMGGGDGRADLLQEARGRL